METPVPRKPGPGRPPKPRKVVPEDLCYGAVKKTRKKGRVTEVTRTLIFGAIALLTLYLNRSSVSSTINTSFVERHNGTDRSQNARKTYAFSKEQHVYDAVTYFVAYSYNFCWLVRTLRDRAPEDSGPRTPAMAAGLADHVWSLGEWICCPAQPPLWAKLGQHHEFGESSSR